MTELRFDNRTAIVTGAGGNPSLGRAHAMLLAARGANVVVNDIGSNHAPGPGTADLVVQEIVAKGGRAITDTNSVTTPAGAAAIVQTALDAFGGVDIVVNNAGVALNAPFDVLTDEDFQRTIDVNLLGPAWVARAAWPHMKAKGYGRIVNITSGAMTGMPEQSAYSASKGGLYTLTRSLAAEGEQYGIRVNAVSPTAFTRMILSGVDEDCASFQYLKNMPAELISPAVAFLAHESCTLTGETLDVAGGAVRRLYWAMTQGIVDTALTPETIAERWEEIVQGTSETRITPIAAGHGLKHTAYTPSTEDA